MKCSVGFALATLVLAGTAWADPGGQPRTGSRLDLHPPTYTARALRDPETTGSLAGSMGRVRVPRDVQGRDIRSSTRGNAQFPERPPVQQNLGGTAGGPEF